MVCAMWSYRPCDWAPFLEIGRLEATRSISLASHIHPDVQVAAVAHGWRAYVTPLGDFNAAPGDIVVIPARLPHASSSGSASIVTHLYIPTGHPAVHGIVVPQIIRYARARSPADMLDAVGSMYRRCDCRSASPAALVEHVLSQNLDVGSMAAQLGYSTDGFIRAFKRQFGMTPAAYRLAHRLAQARSLLKRGYAVANVAHAASFADQSHLGRRFRRAYGATPGAYRSAFTTI
jgi:AraC-like DNA-binding protein